MKFLSIAGLKTFWTKVKSELNKKASSENPVFSTSISLGRRDGFDIGKNSTAVGSKVVASGEQSHSEGYLTSASGECAHSEGNQTISSGDYSHAEGLVTVADGRVSHSEGYFTIASGTNQHVQGMYNISDTENKYVHIVGGGSSDTSRKNIHTIDWNGNSEYSGDVVADKDNTQVSLITTSKTLKNSNLGELSGGKNLVQHFTNGIYAGKYYVCLYAELNLKPDTVYTISFIGVAGHTVYTNENVFTSATAMRCSGNIQSITVTTKSSFPTSQHDSRGWSLFKNSDGGVMPNFTKIQIEEGSQATDYEPYFPSNTQLNIMKADKSETTINLLKPTLQTTIANGITCTNNGDGTFTLNGKCTTTSDEATFVFWGGDLHGTYKILGNPKDDLDSYYIGGENLKYAPAEGLIRTYFTKTYVQYVVAIKPGATLTDLLIKPMITTNLNATYDDFVPYTGNNGKLNKDVSDLLKRIEELEKKVNG